MNNDIMTNCKACGGYIARGVKNCPHCGKDQRSFFGKHKITTAVIILILLGGISKGINGNSDVGPINFADLSTSDQDSFLCERAEVAVKAYLKSPSTAQFPSYSDFYIRKTGESAGGDEFDFEVRSYVDSENGFGAMLRAYFNVDVEVQNKPNNNGEYYYSTVVNTITQ